MLISHRCQFVIFTDPLAPCQWLQNALQPWTDQHIAPARRSLDKSLFFKGMSPAEAELAFDLSDLPYRHYTRIAMVQNPFRRMAQLYDRIAATDPLWRLRHHAGLPMPDFGRWLQGTKPNGAGAGFTRGPRWRRFGAWSMDAWADGRVTHFVRRECAATDLRRVFSKVGVAPLFNAPCDTFHPNRFPEMLRYDAKTIALVRQRYSADLQLYHRPATNPRLVA